MVVSAKLIVYGNCKVFAVRLGFEDVALKMVIVEFWWLASGIAEDAALLGMKFHLPLLPDCYVVKVLFEKSSILYTAPVKVIYMIKSLVTDDKGI